MVPLISSSYANTKIQGNVNKFHNHKDISTYKPTVSPTYYTTKNGYFSQFEKTAKTTKKQTTTSTTTTEKTTPIYLTTKGVNLMESPMNHPSYNYDYGEINKKPETNKQSEIYLTTERNIYLTTKATSTTKKTMSLFEQLFGEYEEEEELSSPHPVKPPPLFSNLPSNKNKFSSNEDNTQLSTTEKPTTEPVQNILTGSHMEHESAYEYEEYSNNNEYNIPDNIAVENNPPHTVIQTTDGKLQSFLTTTARTLPDITEEEKYNKTKNNNIKIEVTTSKNIVVFPQKETTTTVLPSTTTTTTTTTTTSTSRTTTQPATPKVTSLPLGENHVTHSNPNPIIVATQNLKEQLNFEKVPKPITFDKTVYQHAPSTSSIHIAPDQDTISFVVGHHQNVEGHNQNSKGGQYVGSEFKVSPYDHNPFRPLYSQESAQNHVLFQKQSFSNTFNDDSKPGNVEGVNVNSIKIPENTLVLGGNAINIPNSALNQQPHVTKISQPPLVNKLSNSMNLQPNFVNFQHNTISLKPTSINVHPMGSSEISLTSSMNVNPSRNPEIPSFGINNMQFNGNADAPFIVPNGSINIVPLQNSEASLAIGVPVNNVQIKPGQVMDEKLEINNEKVEYPKGTGANIAFPEDKDSTTIIPDLVPPPQNILIPNRDVLKLNSKPMFHQLPSELLTPPSEKEVVSSYIPRPRPPWDPRPGHFYSGRPEYARPPRPPLGPPNNDIYKRIDNLPNILPQFRPNIKMNMPHINKGYMRQPLLERPSNRPIGFFEKLQPPPPPKHFHNLRKSSMPLEIRQNLPPFDYDIKLRQNIQSLDMRQNEENSGQQMTNDGSKIDNLKVPNEQFSLYQTPPNLVIANRRNGEDDPEIETLQMIQAKQTDRNDIKDSTASFNTNLNGKDNIEKPLYVVYPVNTSPVKMDVLNDKKEAVVVGTRAESPLPPSKIKHQYEQDPLLSLKDRHDSPILKPHARPSNYPIKSDFPYPIERPDPTVLENTQEDKLETNVDQYLDQKYPSSNQWNSLGDTEARIVNHGKIDSILSSNQISATLKTYTEKPIAVAYTPTEPHYKDLLDKYSMPNYGSAVIPEIRPGTVHHAELNKNSKDDEFTVSAVMHAHSQTENANQRHEPINRNKIEKNEIKRQDLDLYTTHVPQINQLDFQAPFQASVNLDSISQGWSVVRDKNKTTKEIEPEATTIPIASTSEFDIENFKPQLEGGFKPIYNYPDELNKEKDISEREE